MPRMKSKNTNARAFDAAWSAFAAQHTPGTQPAGTMSAAQYAAEFGVTPPAADAVLRRAGLRSVLARVHGFRQAVRFYYLPANQSGLIRRK